tara:strand:- start:5 stop:160 length:156 start_codon:yes stop_codon:yes gene_type:complete
MLFTNSHTISRFVMKILRKEKHKHNYALKALKDPSFHNIVIVETSDPDTIN